MSNTQKKIIKINIPVRDNDTVCSAHPVLAHSCSHDEQVRNALTQIFQENKEILLELSKV